MVQYDPRVDDYIAKAGEFAKPILEQVREVVHQASPLISETMKWGMPFFDYKGPVCQMAAFKQHCAFGFWKASRLNDPDGLLRKGGEGEESSAGSFGRINSLADLPSDEALMGFVLQAIKLNEEGIKNPVKKVPTAPKAALIVPDYFIDFLSGYPKAIAVFENFSPSHKREYVEWIIEAKTDATRQKRMQQAAELMTEGKSRNWKYR